MSNEQNLIQERLGAVIFLGRELIVLGSELKPGDKAPDFELTATNWSKVKLANSAGKVRLISVVPSLDTRVCDAQTRYFNQEAANLGENVAILTVSADLPYAQRRWCGAAGIDQVQVLSDYFDMNFATHYGTYIKDIRLEQRSVFVVDSNDMVTYSEYIREFGQSPDFEAALAAVRATLEKTA